MRGEGLLKKRSSKKRNCCPGGLRLIPWDAQLAIGRISCDMMPLLVFLPTACPELALSICDSSGVMTSAMAFS